MVKIASIIKLPATLLTTGEFKNLTQQTKIKMGQLIVENLFDDTSLTLEIGKATFGIDDDTLTIEVFFPKICLVLK